MATLPMGRKTAMALLAVLIFLSTLVIHLSLIHISEPTRPY
jgi:hypothetical protein